jgi:hypothetical protein
MPSDSTALTVAVTGPTGTFGYGLMPLLQADPRVSKVIGIARRPFDPAAEGWTKMEYRQGDVRDPEALQAACAGADVVVHLAFLIVGGTPEMTRAINVEGTLNTFRAAADAGAERFVYASSIAAYGFHKDNPVGMTEDWPVRPPTSSSTRRRRPSSRTCSSRRRRSARARRSTCCARRSCSARTPSAARRSSPAARALNKHLQGMFRRLPVPLPAAVPDIPLQFFTRTTWAARCCSAWSPPARRGVQHRR